MAAKKKPQRDPTLDDLLKAGVRYAPLADDEPAPEETKAPETSAWRRAGDVGLSLMKGAIAVPEAAVGLADMATGGRAGKFLENEGGAVGFRPKEAKGVLDAAMSPQQQAANREVQDAEGIVDTGMAALRNPSVIGHSVVESLPLMLGGGVIARSLMKAVPAVGAVAAGAAGEGIASAGSAAEGIRQETPGGLLTGTQSAVAGASGMATGLLGFIGGRVAQKLDIVDVDMLIAGKVAPETSKGFIRQVLQGAFAEGVLEELPQSVQEQVAQNLALDRPLDEGVDKAAVLGTLAGGVMGGGSQMFSRSAGDDIRADKLPESGPLTRSLNAGVEALAREADAAPQAADLAPAIEPAIEPPTGAAQVDPDTGEVLVAAEPTQPPLDNTGAYEQREAGRPPEPTGAPLPGDILNVRGESFKTMRAAMRAKKDAGEGHEIVRVADGLVVRQIGASDGLPDVSAPAGVVDGADAGGSDLAIGSPSDPRLLADDANGGRTTIAGSAAPGGRADVSVGDGSAVDEALTPVVGEPFDGATTQKASSSEQEGASAVAPAEPERQTYNLEDAAVTVAASPSESLPEAPPADRQPVAPERVKVKTRQGANVYVSKQDLDGDKPYMRHFTSTGKSLGRITRDNLDPTGELRAADAKEQANNPLFYVIGTKDGRAFASQAAAAREQSMRGLGDSHEVVPAGDGFAIKRKPAEAPQPSAPDSPRARREARQQATTEGARDEAQQAQEASQASAEEGAEPAVLTPELRQGQIGGKMAGGEIVLTAGGRKTTPFPRVDTGTNRRATATVKAADRWLMQNALAEAEARGDDFNARTFRANLDKPQQSDKDSAEEYLFGEQPRVLPKITRPLSPPKAQAAPTDATTMPEADIAALAGKTVAIEVQVGDTGKTATLTMDAAEAVRDVKKRLSAAEALMRCLA